MVFAILFALSLFFVAQVEVSKADRSRSSSSSVGSSSTLNLEGGATTGWNQQHGQPIFNLPFGVGQMNFPISGALDTSTGGAVAITSSTPLDAPMYTYADPALYQAFFGVPTTTNIPWTNIPYSEYPIYNNHNGSRAPLPSLAANEEWWTESNGMDVGGVTVQKWISAEGCLTFRCTDKETYFVVNAKNLVPGGLYTTWMFPFDSVDGLVGDADFPLGGAGANVFVADKDGNIVNAKRNLNFCPQNVARDAPKRPLAVFLVFHPDAQVWGGVGHLVKQPPNVGPGVNAFPQLMWALHSTFVNSTLNPHFCSKY